MFDHRRVFAVCALLLCPALADAQPPPTPDSSQIPPPRPVVPTPPLTDPGVVPYPGGYMPGSAGPYGVTAQSPSPLLAPEAVVIDRPGAEPGWYGAVSIGLVRPHLASQFEPGNPLATAFGGERPNAPLDWTVSPRFELGYRSPDVRGDIRLGYHFVVASGSENRFGTDLRTRLDLNAIDIDFVSTEWLVWKPPELLRDLRLVWGVRIATGFFDTTTQTPNVLDARFSSQFVGAGPRFGLEWGRPLGATPLELFTRLETSGVVGGTKQDYGVTVRDPAGRVLGLAQRVGPQSDGVAVLGVEAGLRWRPSPDGRLRFAVGYQFEQWWDLGRTDTANANLLIQGVFLRAEWRY